MPLIAGSSYSAPFFLRNGTLNTIFSSVTRRVSGVHYVREQIETPDGDFLDLDWSRVGANRLAVLSHGLEGSSQSPYMLGMTRALNAAGWDVLSWNHRGCGGAPNRTMRLYHSGVTEDLHCVIEHAKSYAELALVGFSLGGNIVLKYLGELGQSVVGRIRAAVCFSVPCDLRASAEALAQPGNRVFMRHFLSSLRAKLQLKKGLFPDFIDLSGLEKIKTFMEFDERFTAPLHGFKNAEEYWSRSSSKRFLSAIRLPTLVINAKDDPMLGENAHLIAEVAASSCVYLELPEHGGHTGFGGLSDHFWSEERTVGFLESLVGKLLSPA